jgi:3-methyladenine DNA glycosylase AlkD
MTNPNPAFPEPQFLAAELAGEISALSLKNTPNVREVRRRYSDLLKQAEADLVLQTARVLLKSYGLRETAYELVRFHKEAFQQLGRAELEEFGKEINSWDTVDPFARLLSGRAWLNGQIDDEVIDEWASSQDLWWRRAALVSTVALNAKVDGGKGDTSRTLNVCRKLVADREDMVVKAMSWALRELVPHDPQAVREFLAVHVGVIAARVKREVNHKLETGLKNPRR